MVAFAAEVTSDAPNPPQAKWMAVIAGLSFNIIIGCLMGSFSVLLDSVEERLHVARSLSSIAGPLVIFGSALIASVAGVLIARYSLRWMLFLAAAMSVAGYLLLAVTASYPLYIASYALLFGPSMAIGGSVGPATLVTRWFTRHRGLALGLVNVSFVVAVMPLLCNWTLKTYGAQATYFMLAGIVAAFLPFTLLVRDHPAGANAMSNTDSAGEASGSMTVGLIVRQVAFWALAIAAAIVITGIMILTFNMIQIASSLGVGRDDGALLQAIMSFAGMAGSILFGWVADRIGGARGLALIAFNFAVLLGLLLLHLPFVPLAIVIGLLGLHGSGMIPNLSRALADAFGRDSFSRAFGLATSLSVPFTLIGLIGTGISVTRTGAYGLAIGVTAVMLIAVVPLVLGLSKVSASSEPASGRA
ncbi:MFS transporter [Novosphingobium sp. G106]|uniref:MFS transporter n=1 Tax=Novosphingobium sp. G106 TaxID=2849500 RepID=UPI001C2D50F6|nr:MFS transporter [Novosphingobium sp. G106]MBV1691318.1 MFS transporter [Novosphingobium sp. G106]